MMLLTTTALVALQVLPQGLALPDTGGCSSDLECHLNGRCVGGLCHCNPAWAAVPNCSVMAVLPGRAEAHQRFGSSESSSWGRSVVDDSTDSRPSRYQVFSNQQWPSCCIRPTTGCVGPPTPTNVTLANMSLPDFKSWRIQTNPGLSFDGSVIATLYSFDIPRYSGMGPGGACSDGDWNCTNATAINGGIPQLVNMSAHLVQLRLDIESYFPNPLWDGIAVIDFGERYRSVSISQSCIILHNHLHLQNTNRLV
jgi:hypothetical protein